MPSTNTLDLIAQAKTRASIMMKAHEADLERKQLHADCKAVIAEARKKAEENKDATPLEQPSDVEKSAEGTLPFKVESDIASIIPYEIINTVTQFDNIYETRLFGWCLAKAQSVLKLYNKDLKDINLQHAMDVTKVTLPAKLLLNPGDKNYKNIGRAFDLAKKQIKYVKDGHQYWLNIIAFPELHRNDKGNLTVSFYIHSQVWHALLDFSHGYRLFNLPTFIRLTSKYSIIMYLLCSQQDAAPKSYGITRLRTLLGCNELRGYDRGNNFIQKILAPAREELIKKAPYYFEYSVTKTGSSGRISEIVIAPRLNAAYIQTNDATSKAVTELRSRLDDDVRRYCQDTFGPIDPRPLERLEPLILALGDKAAQLQRLGEIKTAMLLRRVKNPAGYFTRAIKNTQKA